jgi:hypothetical protein
MFGKRGSRDRKREKVIPSLLFPFLFPKKVLRTWRIPILYLVVALDLLRSSRRRYWV